MTVLRDASTNGEASGQTCFTTLASGTSGRVFAYRSDEPTLSHSPAPTSQFYSIRPGNREISSALSRWYGAIPYASGAKRDGHGVARAAIESCVENLSDGMVAPAFWYVLFGFPVLLVYKAFNAMDNMIGYATPR